MESIAFSGPVIVFGTWFTVWYKQRAIAANASLWKFFVVLLLVISAAFLAMLLAMELIFVPKDPTATIFTWINLGGLAALNLVWAGYATWEVYMGQLDVEIRGHS